LIISCEQCQARFELDEARIPAKGARLRCSRCKHAFFVPHPSASREEAIAEVVAEATGPEGAGAPGIAEDLPGPGDTDPNLSQSLAAAEGSRAGDEEWEFNEDPPPSSAFEPREAGRVRSARRAAHPASRSRQPSPAPEPFSSLDELGRPEEWDLLGGAAQPSLAMPAPPASESVVAQRDQGEASEPAASTAPPPRGAASTAAPSALREPEAALREPGVLGRPATRRASRLSGLGAALGWVLALALAVFGLAAGLQPPPPVPAPLLAARTTSVLGLEVRGIHGRIVENAFAGPLYVVTGRLENAPDATWAAYGTIEVQLVTPDGAPLSPEAVPAAAPLNEALVRELPPDRIRRALASGAPSLLWPPLGPGESRPFQAIFAELSPGAVDQVTDLALRGIALSPPAVGGS
jgi:predicted Zn finger-like uncharacterized protein